MLIGGWRFNNFLFSPNLTFVLNVGNLWCCVFLLQKYVERVSSHQLPVCSLWGVLTLQSFHVLPGNFLPARKRNVLLWSQQSVPGFLVTPPSHRGDLTLGVAFLLPKRLFLMCAKSAFTLAFYSWSGWIRFWFGLFSFIVILECHIL